MHDAAVYIVLHYDAAACAVMCCIVISPPGPRSAPATSTSSGVEREGEDAILVGGGFVGMYLFNFY